MGDWILFQSLKGISGNSYRGSQKPGEYGIFEVPLRDASLTIAESIGKHKTESLKSLPGLGRGGLGSQKPSKASMGIDLNRL